MPGSSAAIPSAAATHRKGSSSLNTLAVVAAAFEPGLTARLGNSEQRKRTTIEFDRTKDVRLLHGPDYLDAEFKLRVLTDVLTCSICGGLYRNATTIKECLHSFCRICLFRVFAKASRGQSITCPECDILLHGSILDSTIHDLRVQRLVNKMFPQVIARDDQVEKDLCAFLGRPKIPPSDHQSALNDREQPPAGRHRSLGSSFSTPSTSRESMFFAKPQVLPLLSTRTADSSPDSSSDCDDLPPPVIGSADKIPDGLPDWGKGCGGAPIPVVREVSREAFIVFAGPLMQRHVYIRLHVTPDVAALAQNNNSNRHLFKELELKAPHFLVPGSMPVGTLSWFLQSRLDNLSVENAPKLQLCLYGKVLAHAHTIEFACRSQRVPLGSPWKVSNSIRVPIKLRFDPALSW